MAETATAPNNAVVKYRGKPEREVPSKATRLARRAIKRGLISQKSAKRYLKGV